jgi:hypothetical protein
MEDVRTFARSQGERLPAEAHQEWLERAILRHVISNSEDLQPSAPTRTELAYAHVARAAAAAETTVRFLPSARLADNAALVVDWVAGLDERDSRLARKLRRVTFEDALAMSQRWHRQLQKAADRRKTRVISADPAGTPTVLEEPSLGPGWHWVWLKSPEARKAEGEVMGHCVGSGGYESLDSSEAILSLRDAESVPHVTLHLEEIQILQAVSKGNDDVPERYLAAVGRAAAIIGTRLLVGENPVRLIHDGLHRTSRFQARVRREMLHCDNGPAVEYANGTKHWYRDGKFHRDEGPAVQAADGTKKWYRDGQLHREDGPAAEGTNRATEWWRNGRLHREDGPAVERADGTKLWYRDGKLHREDGPSLEASNGTMWWYRDGELHRSDGPAVELADGTKAWYSSGKRHRDDGPAVERTDETKEWFREGKQVAPPTFRAM